MLLKLTVTVFVATFIVIVAVGLVLLVAAILRRLREDQRTLLEVSSLRSTGDLGARPAPLIR